MTISLIVIVGCSSDNNEILSISQKNLILRSGETTFLTASEDVVWRSTNEFVVKVDESGKVKANHIGKAFIVASNNNGTAKCEVEVVSIYPQFEEPIIEFGLSKDEVKAKEKRKIFTEEEDRLGYNGKDDNEDFVVYFFNKNKLVASGLRIPLSCSEYLGKCLNERYVLIKSDNRTAQFTNSYNVNNATLLVTTSISENGFDVVYTPIK